MASTDFVAVSTLKDILHISDAEMDQAMGLAYQLYLARRFAEADVMCKGLIACDHRYWWPHSLHASVLRNLNRPAEALQAVEAGLEHEPGQPKLLLMRGELRITLARAAASKSAAPATGLDPESRAHAATSAGSAGNVAGSPRSATRSMPPRSGSPATAAP